LAASCRTADFSARTGAPLLGTGHERAGLRRARRGQVDLSQFKNLIGFRQNGLRCDQLARPTGQP
jgi:hypothetical protein